MIYATIKDPVSVHTFLSKSSKARLKALSLKENIPQCVILNEALTRELARITPKRRK